MILTITTTHSPATDLGYLLYKNPGRLHTFSLSFGQAHVFYPRATSEECTAALLVDVDTVGLVRRRQGPEGDGGLLSQYVNDRPYAASSLLSVAISRVFGSALSGGCRERPELAEAAIPLEARLPVLPARGGEETIRRIFEPLGYSVQSERLSLDDRHPEWGESPYFDVTLRRTCRLADLLNHIYVLIPVLDDEKHYWVGEDEIEKLLRRGEGWLGSHPERDLIVERYLKRQRRLTREALARLMDDEAQDPAEQESSAVAEEEEVERRSGLNEQRLGAVVAALRDSGARSVMDLGCGEGKLIRALMADRQFDRILGMDVSYRSLERAGEALHIDRLPERQRGRLELIHGSLMYRDSRLSGFDAAAVVEVIEHLDEARLAAFERVVFEFARPASVVLTTPNVEYNTRFATLPAGTLRHRDHRFEWTRSEFRQWAESVAARFGYNVRFVPVGDEDPDIGAPTQMGVFTR